MKNENNENLNELLGKFFDPEDVEQGLEDFARAEELFEANPVPMPDAKLVADIKANVGAALAAKKTFRRAVYKVMSVAAAIFITAIISVVLFETKADHYAASIMPAMIWESDDLGVDDAEMVTLSAEIEELESEAMALQLAENGVNGYDAAMELEMELIEIESDFWKG